MDELAYSDATALVQKIKSKQISSADLLEHFIARMEKYNPEILHTPNRLLRVIFFMSPMRSVRRKYKLVLCGGQKFNVFL